MPTEELRAHVLTEVGQFACPKEVLPYEDEIKKLLAIRYKDHSKEFLNLCQ